jgi:hypothetical protein
MREKGEGDDKGHLHQLGHIGRRNREIAHIVARLTEVVMLSFQTAGKDPYDRKIQNRIRHQVPRAHAKS